MRWRRQRRDEAVRLLRFASAVSLGDRGTAKRLRARACAPGRLRLTLGPPTPVLRWEDLSRGAGAVVAIARTVASAAAALLLIGCGTQGGDGTPVNASLVQLADGRRINLQCSGAGAPTVVLEGGYAATSSAWVKVQPVIARTTRVCSYDRAGYGMSDPGPLPRDADAVVDDLDHALRRAHVNGPFVMVGHSAGGLYVRLFADRRWKDVVGMVLVDPSVVHQNLRLAERFGAGAGDLDRLRDKAVRCLEASEHGRLPSLDPSIASCATQARPDASPAERAVFRRSILPQQFVTEISEVDSLWGASSDEVAKGRSSYGDLPLIVLTADGDYAGLPSPQRELASAYWSSLHKEIAAMSTKGQERLVHSGHLVMLDSPQVVIDAINEVVEEARRYSEPRS
jgi:pimeloyl-ACP methyl ester carboxylesterase